MILLLELASIKSSAHVFDYIRHTYSYCRCHFLRNKPLLKNLNPLQDHWVLPLLYCVLNSCIKQIEPGQIGVKVLFGSIQNDVMGSGLHFINPLMDIKRLDVKTHKLHHERY